MFRHPENSVPEPEPNWLSKHPLAFRTCPGASELEYNDHFTCGFEIIGGVNSEADDFKGGDTMQIPVVDQNRQMFTFAIMTFTCRLGQLRV